MIDRMFLRPRVDCLVQLAVGCINLAGSCENVSYVNNKGADQPAHPRSLISTFVVHCLDSMICILALSLSKVSRF